MSACLRQGGRGKRREGRAALLGLARRAPLVAKSGGGRIGMALVGSGRALAVVVAIASVVAAAAAKRSRRRIVFVCVGLGAGVKRRERRKPGFGHAGPFRALAALSFAAWLQANRVVRVRDC
jgi:hypothetical protein